MATVSLALNIKQALASKDQNQLGKLLFAQDQAVVKATARDLTAHEATALLVEVTDRLFRAPKIAVNMCRWARALINHHTAVISADSSLRDSMAEAYAALKRRQGAYEPAVEMLGKVSALCQVSAADLTKVDEIDKEPILRYKEGEEDLSDEESSESEDEGEKGMSDDIEEAGMEGMADSDDSDF